MSMRAVSLRQWNSKRRFSLSRLGVGSVWRGLLASDRGSAVLLRLRSANIPPFLLPHFFPSLTPPYHNLERSVPACFVSECISVLYMF